MRNVWDLSILNFPLPGHWFSGTQRPCCAICIRAGAAPATWHQCSLDLAWRGPFMPFLIEMWNFLRVRKKFWLVPSLLMMALLGGLLVLIQGSSIAPFIYALF